MVRDRNPLKSHRNSFSQATVQCESRGGGGGGGGGGGVCVGCVGGGRMREGELWGWWGGARGVGGVAVGVGLGGGGRRGVAWGGGVSPIRFLCFLSNFHHREPGYIINEVRKKNPANITDAEHPTREFGGLYQESSWKRD